MAAKPVAQAQHPTSLAPSGLAAGDARPRRVAPNRRRTRGARRVAPRPGFPLSSRNPRKRPFGQAVRVWRLVHPATTPHRTTTLPPATPGDRRPSSLNDQGSASDRFDDVENFPGESGNMHGSVPWYRGQSLCGRERSAPVALALEFDGYQIDKAIPGERLQPDGVPRTHTCRCATRYPGMRGSGAETQQQVTRSSLAHSRRPKTAFG